MHLPPYVGNPTLVIVVLLWFSALPLTGYAQQDLEHFNIRPVGRWFSDTPTTNPTLTRYNDCWGFVVNGEEYAVIGSSIGSHIIHIPLNGAFREVAYIAGDGPNTFAIHRDYAVYGDYLYAVCDQAPASLQIIDISGLPEQATVVRSTTEFFTTAHNITADACTGKLYVSGHSNGAMVVLDASERPSDPVLLNNFNLLDYVHDVYVRCDTAYLSAAFQGLFVFEFSDATQPQAIGTLETYPDQGYNHSGWLNESGDLFVFADETQGMQLKVCDVSDPSQIEVLSLLSSGGAPHTTPHNVVIEGDLVYVSYYFDGLQVFDVSDPLNPLRVGWYRTYQGDLIDFRGAWGVHKGLPSGRILISDRQSGLFAFHFTGDQTRAPQPELRIFPNPGGSRPAILVNNSGFRRVEHRVYDLTGRMIDQGVWSRQGDSPWIAVDLSGAPSGHYLIQVIFDEERSSTMRYQLINE